MPYKNTTFRTRQYGFVFTRVNATLAAIFNCFA